MALSKQHKGFGKWIVLDEGVKIAGPMSKDEAEARVLAPPATPKGRMSDDEADRNWQRKLAADLNKPVAEEMAELRALLRKRHDEDETNVIMRQIEPIVIAGKQGLRRERMRFMIPAKAA